MTLHPVELTTQGQQHPLAAEPGPLNLSWQLDGADADRQWAFEVEIIIEGGGVHRSGLIFSDQQRYLTNLRVPPLTRGQWRARVLTQHGHRGGWSEAALFETGLDPADWRASWIQSPVRVPADVSAPVVAFVRRFRVDSTVTQARLAVSALGWYRLFVNGTDLTGDALVPRFTSFDHRVEYNIVDVTSLLGEGENEIRLELADGRYRGKNGGLQRRRIYGDQTALLAQLSLAVEHPLRGLEWLHIGTDTQWQCESTVVTAADPMDGTAIDARHTPQQLGPAELMVPAYEGRLTPADAPPVQCVDRIKAVSQTHRDGRVMLDFGEQLTGVVECVWSAPAGAVATIRHGEALDDRGELDLDALVDGTPLPRLVQEDTFTFMGEGTESFHPPFTVHGFRFAEVVLPPGGTLVSAAAVVLSTPMPAGAPFTSSDDALTQMDTNARRSMRGNYGDIPTDTPGRERSGWTADVQVFAHTALLLADARPVLEHWLRDVAAEQHADGKIPNVVPDEQSFAHPKSDREQMTDGSAGWGDAAVFVPWSIYEHTGDADVLRRSWSMMRAWADFSIRRARQRSKIRRLTHPLRDERFLVDTGFHYGEWLEPGSNAMRTIIRGMIAPDAEVATAYLARTTRIVADAADLLRYPDDATEYRVVADGATRAWQEAFLRKNGYIRGNRQASYVRALAFDLVPERHRALVTARLQSLIADAGVHIGTGFLSTGMLLRTLSDNGALDTAMALLNQTSPPSWRSQLERGATTNWEEWEGIDTQGRAHKSLNHVAPGSFVGFFYDTLLGIRPSEPGYRRVHITPRPDSGLTSASGGIPTRFGRISVAWDATPDELTTTVTLPHGTIGTLHGGVEPIPLEAGTSTHTTRRSDVAAGSTASI